MKKNEPQEEKIKPNQAGKREGMKKIEKRKTQFKLTSGTFVK